MIIVLTVFKNNPGLSAEISPVNRDGIVKKMVETGKMLFLPLLKTEWVTAVCEW